MNQDDFSLIFEKALGRASALFGYELKPHLSHKSPSIDILDLAIRDLMSRQPDIFFLQIGAHDGVSYDPIHDYVAAIPLERPAGGASAGHFREAQGELRR